MALDEPLPNTHAKKKYKTKKEKEKDTTMEELMIVAQTMLGEKLHDEKAQSLWDYVEEVANLLHKNLKIKRHERMKQAWTKQSPMKGLLPLLNIKGMKKFLNRLWSWLSTLTSTFF